MCQFYKWYLDNKTSVLLCCVIVVCVTLLYNHSHVTNIMGSYPVACIILYSVRVVYWSIMFLSVAHPPAGLTVPVQAL